MIHILCNLLSLCYLLGSTESIFSFPYLSGQDISHRFLGGYFSYTSPISENHQTCIYHGCNGTPTCRSTMTTVIVGRAQRVT